MQEWLEEDPLVIVRGEGCYLYDLHDNRYLDGVSSLWANLHGHCRPEINNAIRKQLDLVSHSTLLGLVNPPSAALAKKLIEIAPEGLQRVFYSDCGATAVEIALKQAKQYWKLKGENQRVKFASLKGSYHGDTMGAMSVGYSESFHQYHKELLFPCHRILPPHIFRYFKGMSEDESLKASLVDAEKLIVEHGSSLAAVIIEPLMQGAAGMWVQPSGFIRKLSELVQDSGALLIVDEVATGFGRTGKLFACEHENVCPDILCLGKGISGGYLPLAATLTTEKVFSAFLGEYSEHKTFFHGHTYTGNPLACTAGIASLEIFEKDNVLKSLPGKVSLLEQALKKELSSLEHVTDIRCKGLMVGIELAKEKISRCAFDPQKRIGKRVTEHARTLGVILRPLGDVIILMPPLSITEEDLLQLVQVTRTSIQEVTRKA